MKIRSINKTLTAYNEPIFLVWTNEQLNPKCHCLFHSFKTLPEVESYLVQNTIYNKKQAYSMLAELKNNQQ